MCIFGRKAFQAEETVSAKTWGRKVPGVSKEEAIAGLYPVDPMWAGEGLLLFYFWFSKKSLKSGFLWEI